LIQAQQALGHGSGTYPKKVDITSLLIDTDFEVGFTRPTPLSIPAADGGAQLKRCIGNEYNRI